MYKHIAYNLTTGEIITCDTASYLKNVVRRQTKVNQEWGCNSNKWVFSHNGKVNQKKW